MNENHLKFAKPKPQETLEKYKQQKTREKPLDLGTKEKSNKSPTRKKKKQLYHSPSLSKWAAKLHGHWRYDVHLEGVVDLPGGVLVTWATM